MEVEMEMVARVPQAESAKINNPNKKVIRIE